VLASESSSTAHKNLATITFSKPFIPFIGPNLCPKKKKKKTLTLHKGHVQILSISFFPSYLVGIIGKKK
jgi:hypothetical protein